MESFQGITVQQVQTEYEEGQNFLRQRKNRWVKQLVLMNNLRRGDENIASTMLFSYFNKVLSNLYSNSMDIRFFPSEDSEYKKIEALGKLAKNDYREMSKDVLDYDWDWDACFFGRGYCDTMIFDKKRKILKPHVINPLVMTYDPYFESPKEWRYYNKWIFKSMYEIARMIRDGMIDGISHVREIVGGADIEIWDYKVRREQAQEGNTQVTESESPNQLYQILEHYTHTPEGEKAVVWVDKNFSKILRGKILDFKDAEDGKHSEWSIITREIFKIPHSSMPISVPDIIEDKDRALNVLYNLCYLAAKDEANPIYAYDIDAIQDVTQLLQRQVQQHIPVQGNPNNVIAPLRSTPAMSNSLAQFIGILKSESAETIGTTQIAQPMQRGKRSATESALLQQVSDLTQSLSSKIIAQSEMLFWEKWYHRYVRYSKAGDKKLISLTSVSEVTFENIKLDDLATKFPPKVEVLSAKEAEYKEMVERRELAQQFQTISTTATPQNFVSFLKYIYFPKFSTLDSNTIDMVFPKSIDEIKSQQENEMLNEDELPNIHESDDDTIHMYVHSRAKNTPSKWAHYFAHEQQLADKKVKEAEAKAAEQNKGATGGGGSVGAGGGAPTNAEAAVPLQKAAIQPVPNIGIKK